MFVGTINAGAWRLFLGTAMLTRKLLLQKKRVEHEDSTKNEQNKQNKQTTNTPRLGVVVRVPMETLSV